MDSRTRDSEDTLRQIDELAAEARHSDVEAREMLESAGIDPDTFARAVRQEVQAAVPKPELRTSHFELRTFFLGVIAASVAFAAVSVHFNYRAGLEAQRQLARAQLIGPLLPALSSEDPERRSIALVVAQQVDPAFAAETSAQLARWDVNTQARARAYRNTTYADRILAGIQKLEISRDPEDRKAAIWNDLLPVLVEARRNRNEFVDVAIEYQRVLPLLSVRNPDVFLDSYWGELWILNILLESRIVPVVEAARRAAPEPAVVEAVFQKNASGLPERDRLAFEEAKSAYVRTLTAIR
ncbi:MAG TPA: hypothetical protein VN700_00020 [Vicinamibacterales bacterium]|nr:hypothetical protein [Vicinamibacterales bacterium]